MRGIKVGLGSAFDRSTRAARAVLRGLKGKGAPPFIPPGRRSGGSWAKLLPEQQGCRVK